MTPEYRVGDYFVSASGYYGRIVGMTEEDYIVLWDLSGLESPQNKKSVAAWVRARVDGYVPDEGFPPGRPWLVLYNLFDRENIHEVLDYDS
jgi:hypothetical protein